MNRNEFASARLTAGQLNAIVKRLGGHDGAMKFIRGEIVVAEPQRTWREHNGVIYFSVTSHGTTGEEWIERLGKKGLHVDGGARSVLRSPDFRPTNRITTEIAVLKAMLFNDHELSTERIREIARRRELEVPNAEVACLIREAFSDEEMKEMCLWSIAAMHKPIEVGDDGPYLLFANRDGGGRRLDAHSLKRDYPWLTEHGFAFVVSQVTS